MRWVRVIEEAAWYGAIAAATAGVVRSLKTGEDGPLVAFVFVAVIACYALVGPWRRR